MNNKTNMLYIIITLMFAIVLSTLYQASAIPSGASIDLHYSTRSNGSAPGSRNDSGGQIYGVTFNAIAQNYNWKAYLGNVTGSYTLADAQGAAIYDWPSEDQTSGEVFASRGSAVNWDAINCSTPANLTKENAFFGFAPGSTDSINATFNNTRHTQFVIGTRTITANTCYSTQLFQNNTRPDSITPIHNYWQEIMLQDNVSIVYATKIQNKRHGYNQNQTDFQLMVPENGTAASHVYYFWVQI